MKRRTLAMILTAILSLLGCENRSDKSKGKNETELFFETLNNRKIYKKLTKEIIDTISDNKLEETIFDNIYVLIGEDYKNELSNVKKLSIGQQAFWSTWILEGEVNNGGFNQFYYNSSGQYAKMAEKGFELIGATEYAKLTQRANVMYNENKKHLEKFNDGTLESFSESYKDNPLNKLDDEFYNLGDSESISQLRIKYIRGHLVEFTN